MSKPEHGRGGKGQNVNPSELPEELVVLSDDKPRAAPSPGVPVSDEDYKRMKEAAEIAPTRDVKNAQEDRPKKRD